MKSLFAFTLIALLLSACGATAATPTQPSAPTNTPMATIDPNMEQGPVFVNSADLLIAESYPVQVRLHVQGDLPTPCHHFRADVAAPNTNNEIHVSAYSLVNPDLICAQMLQPFDENVAIPMQGAADGSYSIYLNGELVGEFNYPG